ncbi:immunity 53 family protein [Nostoc ellipsosporum NOK]|nr:immunity 53 family protein [Nostoc ellipsosporum NOK]
MLEWLQQWYLNNCDGSWEHDNQIKIYTLDNPGWTIEIDLNYTLLDGAEINDVLIEVSEEDWYTYFISNNVFKGAGDPSKLSKLIEVFKELYDNKLKG